MLYLKKMFFSCCRNNNAVNNKIDTSKITENPSVEHKINIVELDKTYNKLKNIIDHKTIPYFSFKGKFFYALPCNIYDGDTFSVIFEYKDEILKYHCRCMGYDCAEMKPLLSNPNRDHEKVLAHNAKNRLIELINKHETKLIKIECFDFDKYGRLLINFWNMVDTKSINQIMIEEGHGKPYDGGTKDKW